IDPEPVKEQPQAWRCIGQEVSEQLDYEPARFLRRRIVRRKYVHGTDRDSAPVIAALPERLLDRSLPAPGLLAHILISIYCDHLPLYRQEYIFLRLDRVPLPRPVSRRWVRQTSAAPFSAMVTRPIGLLPMIGARASDWPVVGHTCGGSFTRRWNYRRERRAGSCAKSNTSMEWRGAYASRAPD